MVRIRKNDSWLENGLSVGSGETVSKTLEVDGSDRVTGIVNRSANYTIDIEYLDHQDNVIATEEEVGGTAASGNQQFAEDAHTDKVTIKVIDEATSAANANIGVKLR